MEYDPKGVGTSKKHKIRITDKIGEDAILGPDGVRTGIHLHEWSPHDTEGCFAFGTNGGTEEDPQHPGADALVEAVPDLANDVDGDVMVIIEARDAMYNKYLKRWEGVDNSEDRFRVNIYNAIYEFNKLAGFH
jgi:hypothetical protein